MDRSWGYNPASFFAPESSTDRRGAAHFVDAAHRSGLAVIFDVVYNHAGPGDNVLWDFDGYTRRRHLLRGRPDDGGAAGPRGGSGRCRTSSTRTPACTLRSITPTGCDST